MRTPRLALVIAAVAALWAAGDADARVAAHGQQKLAVMNAVLDPHVVPIRCEDVWISSLSRFWATVYAAGSRTKALCPKYAYNDQWFVHQVRGKWRNVSDGDVFMCPRPHPAPGVPYTILRDLIGCD